jgi:hypothetical protein
MTVLKCPHHWLLCVKILSLQSRRLRENQIRLGGGTCHAGLYLKVRDVYRFHASCYKIILLSASLFLPEAIENRIRCTSSQSTKHVFVIAARAVYSTDRLHDDEDPQPPMNASSSYQHQTCNQEQRATNAWILLQKIDR